ncbi:preprotein translocase subunit SecY [Candidatus Uhrbacteria bacterium]|nr:preprotein translocase subunit SecY [Candidatus Uhrbacteria bacterium]
METLRSIWKLRDLRNSLLYVFGMLLIFRIAAHIPIPGVDAASLNQLFATNQFFGLLNIFSGGALEQFSVVAMGVAPYITASIIFQLLVMVIPSLEELQKEGEYGRMKINQYTRYATVPLAALQAFGLLALLEQGGRSGGVKIFQTALSRWETAVVVVTLVAGSVFLMWIGELVSEKHVGNGISLLIFAGILSGLITGLQQFFSILDPSQIPSVIAFTVIGLTTIIGIVVMNEGQRNIPVSYAKIVRGNRMLGGVNTHLPLRVSQAGVIPIIFAISIILFPPTIAQFLLTSTNSAVRSAATFVQQLFNNQLFYGIAYFVLVFLFTYFYTAVIFQPEQIAENLQKQGGFIPGIRPGRPTAEYLQTTINRLILPGAVFLSLIAVLPIVVQTWTGITTLTVGGTSILIVVSVVIESVKQIQAQITMRQYEGY